MASDKDRYYEIDKWARLFKAGTWEDIKMLAEDNKYIESAAKGMFFKTQDESILRLCRKMDEEIEGDKRRAERLVKLEEDIAKLETEYTGLQTEYTELQTGYTDLKAENSDLKDTIARLQAELAELKK